MAQDRLIAAVAGGVVLAGGAAVELVRASSVGAGLIDWAVGAAWAVAAVRSAGRGGRGQVPGLATAAAWFLATALAPAELLAIAYRGPLLWWTVDRSVTVRRRPFVVALVVAGAAASLVATAWAAVVTAGVALALAVLLLGPPGPLRPVDPRRTDRDAAVLAASLALLWLLAVLDALAAPVLQGASTVLLLASAWVLSRPAPGLAAAIGSMVLELGPSSSRASPVSASLAAALADPALRIRAYRPDLGWRDEAGRPVPDPAADPTVTATTGVDTPGRGRVVVLHGPGAVPEAGLARAAAAAAALVLERVAVEAQVRGEADEVRRSTARLLTVNDAERHALAARLEAGPIARLEAVGRSLRAVGGEAEPLLDELAQVMTELHGLAAGLGPLRLSRDGLGPALRQLADGVPLPVVLVLSGPVDDVADTDAALVYFVCAECLTNTVRHARARSVRLRVAVEGDALGIEVGDDGRGGASLGAGHGLQGLADRLSLAGGTLEVVSPADGPTTVRAVAPIRGRR